MAISFAEPLEIQCPECGTAFTTETWIVVDGNERPDLVGRILDNMLHDARCPTCGQVGQVPAPLLYHDGRAERVLLAVPADMPDDELREAGPDAVVDADRRAPRGAARLIPRPVAGRGGSDRDRGDHPRGKTCRCRLPAGHG